MPLELHGCNFRQPHSNSYAHLKPKPDRHPQSTSPHTKSTAVLGGLINEYRIAS